MMLQLIKMTRDGSTEIWQEHFKTVLLLLLETLGDVDVSRDFNIERCGFAATLGEIE